MSTYNWNKNDTSGYTEAFINAFTAGYEHVLQEQKRTFGGMVREGRLVGEYQSYDFLGTIELDDKESRFEDIPLEDMDHNRRWIYPKWARKGIPVDDEDKIAMHADPTSPYIEALAKACIRKENSTTVAAFFADVTGGKNPADDTFAFSETAYTTSSAAGRVILHDAEDDFTSGGVSSGLTIEKLILAKQALGELDNDPDEKFYICHAPKQMSDLLRQAETQSIDTNIVRSLAAGVIHEYMGFTFVQSNRITLGTNNAVDTTTEVYELPVWTKDGMLFARHEAPIFSVDKLPRKQIWQISARCGMNAIRLDEDKVLRIECI